MPGVVAAAAGVAVATSPAAAVARAARVAANSRRRDVPVRVMDASKDAGLNRRSSLEVSALNGKGS